MYMKSTGTQSAYDLQRLDLKTGHQDSGSKTNHKGDMSHCFLTYSGDPL